MFSSQKRFRCWYNNENYSFITLAKALYQRDYDSGKRSLVCSTTTISLASRHTDFFSCTNQSLAAINLFNFKIYPFPMWTNASLLSQFYGVCRYVAFCCTHKIIIMFKFLTKMQYSIREGKCFWFRFLNFGLEFEKKNHSMNSNINFMCASTKNERYCSEWY